MKNGLKTRKVSERVALDEVARDHRDGLHGAASEFLRPLESSGAEAAQEAGMSLRERMVRLAAAAAKPLLRPLFRAHEKANASARRNAEALIAACRAFQARHGHLPESLEALVPEFLPSLPPARYDGPHFGFKYEVDVAARRHVLSWTDAIPFGRPFYVFEEDRWGYLD